MTSRWWSGPPYRGPCRKVEWSGGRYPCPTSSPGSCWPPCDHTPRDDDIGGARPCAEAVVAMELVGAARDDGEGSAKRRRGSSRELPTSERGAAPPAVKVVEARPVGAENDPGGKLVSAGPGLGSECAPIVVDDDPSPSAVAACRDVQHQRLHVPVRKTPAKWQ